MTKKVLIFDRPLNEKESMEHTGKILKSQIRYHLIDCLKELKYGRMAEDQKYIDVFIEFIEVIGYPSPSELINGVWKKGEK